VASYFLLLLPFFLLVCLSVVSLIILLSLSLSFYHLHSDDNSLEETEWVDDEHQPGGNGVIVLGAAGGDGNVNR
jgi:hypothetical protein